MIRLSRSFLSIVAVNNSSTKKFYGPGFGVFRVPLIQSLRNLKEPFACPGIRVRFRQQALLSNGCPDFVIAAYISQIIDGNIQEMVHRIA